MISRRKPVQPSRRSDVPIWVRGVLAADRLTRAAGNAFCAMRDEVLCSFVGPEVRPLVNALIYDRETKYLPGGRVFEAGLFEWEREAIHQMRLPKGASVLLGGAGAGRELVGLCRLGFSVAAFEPSPRLAAALRGVATQQPHATVEYGSYSDLVLYAERGTGRLAPLLARRFDGVILGWGSFSHLLTNLERSAVLAAIRAIAPEARVLLSHLPPPPERARPSAPRRAVRALLRRLASAERAEPATGFLPEGGFYIGLTRDDVVRTAAEVGYRIDVSVKYPYPHVVLVPSSPTIANGSRTRRLYEQEPR
jgi:hypothetical protein